MIRTKRLLINCQQLLLLFTLFITSICNAGTQPAFSKIVFFGDSLTDNGNLYSVFDGFMPKSPPYFDGRFSNGNIWSDLLTQHYQAYNITSDNYAVGGETVILHNPVDGYLPFTITASLYDYLIRTMYSDRSNILYIIWVGANDYLPGFTNADELSSYVISNIQSVIDSLIYHGAKHIIVINLPDLGKTPHARQANITEQLSNITKLHNAKLETMVSTLAANYKTVSIHLFDINALFTAVLDNHTIPDTTTACWAGSYTLKKDNQETIRSEFNQYMRSHALTAARQTKIHAISPQAMTYFPDYAALNPALLEAFSVSKSAAAGDKPCDDPDTHVFWDHVHPTKIMHQLLADNAIQFIDQVEGQG